MLRGLHDFLAVHKDPVSAQTPASFSGHLSAEVSLARPLISPLASAPFCIEIVPVGQGPT